MVHNFITSLTDIFKTCVLTNIPYADLTLSTRSYQYLHQHIYSGVILTEAGLHVHEPVS